MTSRYKWFSNGGSTSYRDHELRFDVDFEKKFSQPVKLMSEINLSVFVYKFEGSRPIFSNILH